MVGAIVIAAIALAIAAIPVVATVGPKLSRPKTKVLPYDARIERSPWSIDAVSDVLTDLLQAWPNSKAVYARLKARLDLLDIYCRQERFWLSFGQKVAGIWSGAHRVEVGSDYASARESSLAHEAAHDFCHELFGDPDEKHERKEIWDAVYRVQKMI